MSRSWVFGASMLALALGTAPARAQDLAQAAVSAAGSGAMPPVSATLPTDGVVVAGQIGIAGTDTTLTVTQASARGIVDWGGFSIGSGASVRFENGSGATLNRVTGTGVSQIDGLLGASGSVYLINSNGVIVGKSGVVDVGGSFVASTLGIANEAFLSGGDLALAGSSTAAVVNLGKLGALGGDIALVARTVRNEGAITAPNGSVGLLAGTNVLLRDATLDGGRFAVLVGGAEASATNTGTIAGAMAELRANGGNVYALAGETGGVIRATGVSSHDGRIFLIAEGGAATVAARLEAGTDGAPGFVETSGDTVALAGAQVDAHGGTWLIDPTDLTIDNDAAYAISATLNLGTNVTERTTASGASGAGIQSLGGGDITVAGPISWSSGATLFLDAYRSVLVNQVIIVSGPGKLVIYTNDGGAGGDLRFNLGLGRIDFSGTPNGGQALTINSQAYQLVYSFSELQGLSNATGFHALARYLPNPNDPFYAAVVGGYNGTFEGLGHAVEFAIQAVPAAGPVGLFGYLSPTATVRNIALYGNVSGGDYAGMLAGYSLGAISNVSAAGLVQGQDFVGGLVGRNDGILLGDGPFTPIFANTQVSGRNQVGALIGLNTGTVIRAETYEAVATATGGGVGGIAGVNTGTILGANARPQPLSGAVNSGVSYVGGLVGYNAGTIGASGGTPSGSSAKVSGTYFVGGLVGINTATGTIGGTGATTYASGAASGTDAIGGLAGENDGTIVNAIATGAVSGRTSIGGLVGGNGGTVIDSVASGKVTATGSYAGGLVGYSQGPILGSRAMQTGTATVSGPIYVGGLVGYSARGGSIGANGGVASSAAGAVSGTDTIGGLVGRSDATITGASASGTVSGTTQIGGLTGQNAGTITGSSAAGSVTATSDLVGGLVGANRGAIASSAATGAVTGNTNQVGGLVGSNLGTIDTSQARGRIGGNAYVGGLVGYNGSGASVSNSQAYGQVDGSADYVGGFVGYNDTRGTVATSQAYGQVNGSGNYVGGLVGWNYGTVTGATSAGAVTVSAGYGAGGLAGANSGTIARSLATGNVVGKFDVGGLAGGNVGTITGSEARGNVTGESSVGGLVGSNRSCGFTCMGTIQSSQASGAVMLTAASGSYSGAAGGLVGSNSGSISVTRATGAVSGAGTLGGLVGINIGDISQSEADGAVTRTGTGTERYDGAGGLVGATSYASLGSPSSITDSFSTGTVTAAIADGTGGLIGHSTNSVSTSYSIGAVNQGGGLLGYNTGGYARYQTSMLTNLYWDVGTSGQSMGSYGQATTPGVTGIGGTTGLDPTRQSTYAGFDFATVWQTGVRSDGRPSLRAVDTLRTGP